jgi:hypothetical protein
MNPFTQFGDSFLPRRGRTTRVVQRESQAPQVLRGAEKEIAENNALLRRYLRHKMTELKMLLDGECGSEVRELRSLLRELTPASGPRLLQFLEDHGWFQNLDRGARYAILDLIDAAIIRTRIRNGLPPMDDSLPGEPPTIFELCRSGLIRDK